MGEQFEYPPQGSGQRPEMEVLGQEHCVEALEQKGRVTMRQLEGRSVDIPSSLKRCLSRS